MVNTTTGELWEVEHGPRGGDELNRPEKGKDYGWPTITFGLEYSGKPVGDCRPLSAEESAKLPPNMRAPMICPRERSPVKSYAIVHGSRESPASRRW